MRARLALSLAGAVAFATPAAAADFCPDFLAVYSQGVSGFRSMRGVMDADVGSWNSTVNFPGASWCDVSEDPNYFKYGCTWRYGAGQAAQAVAAARALADGVRVCFRGRVLPPEPDRDQPPPRAANARPSDAVYLWRDRIAEANTRQVVVVLATHNAGSGRRIDPERQAVRLTISYLRRQP